MGQFRCRIRLTPPTSNVAWWSYLRTCLRPLPPLPTTPIPTQIRKQLFEERFGAVQAATRKARNALEAVAQEAFFALLQERHVTASTR